MRQPLVAITSDVRTFENYTWHAAPDQYLMAAYEAAGVIPLIVPSFGESLDIDAILDGVKNGILQPDLDVEEIAREVLATSDGLTLQWGLSSRSFDMAHSIRTYLDRLARQITTDHRGLPKT